MKNLLEMLFSLISHKLRDPILSWHPHPRHSLLGQLIVDSCPEQLTFTEPWTGSPCLAPDQEAVA